MGEWGKEERQKEGRGVRKVGTEEVEGKSK